ncbi:MAG: Fic family protein [Myxococcaceae bacterium]
MELALRQEDRQPERQFFRQPEQMAPFLSTEGAEALSDLAVQVIRESAALGSLLHPVTRKAVASLLRQMNSYYSNLIEGHYTRPVDIEKALKAEYTADPAKRALQLEHRAHVQVQQEIERRLLAEPDLDICSAQFLSWVHARFYEQLPEELRVVQDSTGSVPVNGGELRSRDVEVGRHLPPPHNALPAFMDRYAKAYSPKRLGKLNRVIAAAASHHRLAWIHPFLDGNGRVARLFTHAYLIRAEVDAQGLWAVTRGFARQREGYLSALAGADAASPDGKPHLSDPGLQSFCEFFLNTALDQLGFMASLLELDNLQMRVLAYAQRQVLTKQLKPGAGLLLRDVLLRGEVERGEAGRITGMSASAAREIVRQLLEEGLLLAESPKGPVRLGLPVKAVGYFFPRLYPEGVEEE